MTIADFSSSIVLVTGGAGFIGSHLVDALLSRGATVRVMDNFATGYRRNLSHCLARIELLEEDIRDLDACLRAARGASYVFHQAALGSVPRSMADPATALAVNIGGTSNIFTAARDAKVKRVVYASSSSVYGDSETLPKREGEEGRALSPYAISKWVDEEIADVFEACYGMQLVGLRYFNVYGPRQDPKGPYAAVIPRFFAACQQGRAPVIFGDGTQSRDFTFVEDVVDANLRAASAAGCSGRAYNIGAGGRTTVNELAETICRVMGFDGSPEYTDPRPGDVLHSLADISAARRAFGYEARTSLQDGLAKTKPVA